MIPSKMLWSMYNLRLEEDLKINGCRKCPALVACRNDIVIHRGNPKGEVMVIGEAPGVTEDETGFPFMGKSGKYLDGMLERIGLTEDQVYITNAVKCRPPGNRNPTPKEQDNCFGYLEEQMKHVKPKVILLLGRIAAKSFFDMDGVSLREMMNGLYYIKEFPGTAFMVYYHPSYLLRNQHKRQWIRKIEGELDSWINTALAASYALK